MLVASGALIIGAGESETSYFCFAMFIFHLCKFHNSCKVLTILHSDGRDSAMMRKFVGLDDPEDRVLGAFVMGKVSYFHMLCYVRLGYVMFCYVVFCYGKGFVLSYVMYSYVLLWERFQ